VDGPVPEALYKELAPIYRLLLAKRRPEKAA
jgi:hypothetical protein